MGWSLRARRSGIGSDSWRSTDEGSKQIGDGDQCVEGNDRIGDGDHRGTSFPGRHPLRQEAPGPVGKLTAERTTTIAGPLETRDSQRLADERVPAVINGDGSSKLRSM